MEDLYNSSSQFTQSSQGMPEPQKGDSKTSVVWTAIMLVLLMGAAGFGVWQWYEVGNKNSEIDNLQTKNKQLESQVANLEQGSSTGATTAASDSDKILASVAAYTLAPVAAASQVFNYSITTNKDNFAKVNVEVEGGSSYNLVLKKVDGAWTVVISSKDNPTQQQLDAFGIPASIYQL